MHKILLAATIIIISFYLINSHNTPDIVGTWYSEETGEKIIFNENGSVELENVNYIPKYEIITPTKMIYTINNQVFEMNFRIEDNQLYWGISEPEIFSKKKGE
ncbi:hypothetical protein AN639_03290 [Candidatus Epulonipiscium fishelsonii]|uniref:Uncharacterized protein n=1 Tax=Candidatus Epulonipiscium fishelsonii TaxID=77094 RepID=A0ACC8XGM9_9FIRM|nr:hypothetical protein AN639_03290 [Epulopiscium sp. SCG-B05WGA-EpuloA1]ONI42641.1 hypothetical protein AN396_13745 [Epulopiscium sp. SCG-B11WGA-EpuloA1]ONI47259.1 hypothetical protein AN644_00985 [Epulopiscium sp. SCG-C06WGA-EpuloA1]